MKRILLLVLLTSVLLSACETATDKVPTGCAPGYEVVENDCVKIEDPICDDDEILVNGACVDKVEGPSLDGPDYQEQGYELYSNRDIVNDECSHLDNIGEWQPVWCDEFDYVGLPDSSKWSYDVGGHGWGNGEAQYYTNADEDNVYVDNGVLTITSIKEYFGGNDYTSTRLISKDTGDWLYGKIQVRAKVPAGRGTWPAIWMLPTDWEYGGWPTSGEIDIMEYVGYDENVLHATIHTGAYNHMKNTQIGKARTLNTIEEEFHVYEIEWEPNIIRFYLNGENFYTVDFDPEDSYHVLPHEAWPFDKDFHLLINTAIGGAWGGAQGIEDSIFPVDFVIDYVRVYQKDYSGMDSENPSKVLNIKTLDLSQNTAYVAWDSALDDVMVKEYEIMLDNQVIDVVTHNAIFLDNLRGSTSYNLKVTAIDFANNRSETVSFDFVTDEPLNVDSRIEAEDYISMDGIETESTDDVGGGLNVGWIDTNDTMTYEIVVKEAGTYLMKARVASQGGSTDGFNVKVGPNSFLFNDIPSTGGWQTWTTITSNQVTLEPGTYIFTFESLGSGYNVNYFEFEKLN